jgi:hypothetical protein
MNEQIIQVWKCLLKNKVNYLTVGGLAVTIYGYGRNTGVIDVFIDDTIANRENLRNALKELGVGDYENILTMQFLPGWTDISLNFNLRLDIMTSIKGLEDKTFTELMKQATIAEINDVHVYFLDYNNLIIAKKASNQPKDLLDIEELEKLNRDL